MAEAQETSLALGRAGQSTCTLLSGCAAQLRVRYSFPRSQMRQIFHSKLSCSSPSQRWEHTEAHTKGGLSLVPFSSSRKVDAGLQSSVSARHSSVLGREAQPEPGTVLEGKLGRSGLQKRQPENSKVAELGQDLPDPQISTCCSNVCCACFFPTSQSSWGCPTGVGGPQHGAQKHTGAQQGAQPPSFHG